MSLNSSDSTDGKGTSSHMHVSETPRSPASIAIEIVEVFRKAIPPQNLPMSLYQPSIMEPTERHVDQNKLGYWGIDKNYFQS